MCVILVGMPRVGWVKPQDDQRLSDHVALGVLTRTFPPELVDAVVVATGKVEQRSRLLPARVVVYYVMGLALFSRSGYEEVMRSLVEGLSWESGWKTRWTVPSQPAISQARARMGPEPLKLLFERGCVPLGTEAMPGAFMFGRRLVSMDGTSVDVPDTAGNEAAFGRPGSARGEGAAFPKLRILALAECGTHAIFGAELGAYTIGENTMARSLIAACKPGMLVFADRGFGGSYTLFTAFAERRGSVLEGTPERGAADHRTTRRRVVLVAARLRRRPHQDNRGASDRVRSQRPRKTPVQRPCLPAGDHHLGPC